MNFIQSQASSIDESDYVSEMVSPVVSYSKNEAVRQWLMENTDRWVLPWLIASDYTGEQAYQLALKIFQYAFLMLLII